MSDRSRTSVPPLRFTLVLPDRAHLGAWSFAGNAPHHDRPAGFALGAILWAILAVVEFGAWVLDRTAAIGSRTG